MNRTGKRLVSVVGSFGILACLFVVVSMGYVYLTNTTLEQTLATDLNVSGEWKEIDAAPALQTRRNVSEVTIALPNYRAQRGGPFEIKLSDGRIVHPQIQVVDLNGQVVDVTQMGFNFTEDHDLVVFTPKGGFPHTSYSKLRIRSDDPFLIERLTWRERNPK